MVVAEIRMHLGIKEEQVYIFAVFLPMVATAISSYLSEGPDPQINYIVMFAFVAIGALSVFLAGFSLNKLLITIFIYLPCTLLGSFIVLFVVGCMKGYCL